MKKFLRMARAGRVNLFGDGSNRINPIHAADWELNQVQGLTRYVATVLVIFVANAAQAQTAESQDDRENTAAFYFWGTDVGGNSISGSEIEVDFSDIRDNLEAGFMGSFGTRRNGWSLFADVNYFNLAAKETADLSIPVGPVLVPVTTSTELDQTGWTLHFGGGYELFSADKSRLDVVGGVRYMDLDTEIFLELASLGPGQSRTISDSTTAWDAFIGLRGRAALGERWYLPYYLDIGAGESSFTWQAALGLTFQASMRWEVALLYRHLEWDLDTSRIIDEISYSGPMLGAAYRW